jgi:transcriptional regulator with XRE-family HTH domain
MGGVGRWLDQERTRRGWSRRRLAAEAGVPLSTLRGNELHSIPSEETLARYHAVLGGDFAELLALRLQDIAAERARFDWRRP